MRSLPPMGGHGTVVAADPGTCARPSPAEGAACSGKRKWPGATDGHLWGEMRGAPQERSCDRRQAALRLTSRERHLARCMSPAPSSGQDLDRIATNSSEIGPSLAVKLRRSFRPASGGNRSSSSKYDGQRPIVACSGQIWLKSVGVYTEPPRAGRIPAKIGRFGARLGHWFDHISAERSWASVGFRPRSGWHRPKRTLAALKLRLHPAQRSRPVRNGLRPGRRKAGPPRFAGPASPPTSPPLLRGAARASLSARPGPQLGEPPSPPAAHRPRLRHPRAPAIEASERRRLTGCARAGPS